MARIRKNSLEKGTVAFEKRIWHIAVYIRLSRDDGNDESLSVSSQRKILLEFVEQSFQGEAVVEDIYTDDGQTGTDYERPDFQRMIHDVEIGKVNCILCKNLSRAFRNYSDQGYFLENFFPRFHTRFIALGDPKVDTFTDPEAVNGMEIPINGLMNDRFAYKTSSDIRRTFDTKRRKGEFIGAFAPYGYSKSPEDKNSLIIDPEAAEVVKNIFQWYVCGDGSGEMVKGPDGIEWERPKGSMSKEGIARKLNALGILNPSAYKRSKRLKYQNPHAAENDGLWQGGSVAKILSNEMYVGTMVQGKQRVISYKVHERTAVPEAEWYKIPNTHEPIIDKKTFALAQEIGKKDIRCAPGKQQNYLFSGFLKCADCHKAMTRKTSKGIVYFNCSTYKRKSKEKCTIHSLRLDVLESVVWTVIQKQIAAGTKPKKETGMTKKFSTEQQKIKQQKAGRLKALLKQRCQEEKKVETLLTELYLDWKNGDISREQYRKVKDRLETRDRQIKAAVSHIEEEMTAADSNIKDKMAAADLETKPFFCQDFPENKNSLFLCQGLLAQMVKEILIHENREITMVFKFEDPYLPVLVSSSKIPGNGSSCQ